MTQDQAKKLLPFVQAVADGKTLQCRFRTNPPPDWHDLNLEDLSLDVCECYDVRIKPEPRVVWVNEYKDGSNVRLGDCAWPSLLEAEALPLPDYLRSIKFAEVIEP